MLLLDIQTKGTKLFIFALAGLVMCVIMWRISIEEIIYIYLQRIYKYVHRGIRKNC
jgi:hypothetical protein